MKKGFIWLICSLVIVQLQAQQKRNIYVVRHAEKEGALMTNNPPLSAKGKERAEELRRLMSNQFVTAVFSTGTQRTDSTAYPVAKDQELPLIIYKNDSIKALVNRVKEMKGNVLIVGHSNTVDDIVNAFIGGRTLRDLPDSVYNKLYLIRYKEKTGFTLREKTYWKK